MRASRVRTDKVGQPLVLKGKIAEDSFLCPEECFWGITEYVIHCHRDVECYRCYGNMENYVTMSELFTKSFMVFYMIRNFSISYHIKRSARMRRGAYNEDVALQPRPAREFACKLFVLQMNA